MMKKRTTSGLKSSLFSGSLPAFVLLLASSAIIACTMALATPQAPEKPPEQEIQTTTPEDQDPNVEGQETTTQTPQVTPEITAGFENAVIIGQYTAISSVADVGRIENLRLAAESIDGIIIEPGGIFSFNAVVGDVERDNRYQLAPVVADGALAYGRGGGTCQVSSALYIAALYTNLKIVERHPHSAVVDYVPIGLDATVSYSSKDLKLSNETGYPIKINAVAEGQSVTVTILGHPLEEGIRIEPLSVLLEYHRAGTPLPSDVSGNADLINSSFYIVESFRVFYYHGNQQESVLLSRDLYLVLNEAVVRLPDGNLETTK